MKNKMQLDIYQKKAVEASEDKILCLAAAGSGKTRALTERIRYLIENKNQDPMQIVAITFTNTAADEMKKRLEDVRQGTFIGTLHSYANFICLKNGIDTTKYIEMKEFDKIIEKAILISRNKYPQIDHLLIDEAQDLGELDYQFIEKIPTKNIFFVADDRQAIYQFRGCSDKYIRNMALDDNYKKYYLNFNYRCAPNIQNFANSLLWSYTALSPCPDTYKKRNGILERNMTIDDALSELEWSKNWGSWFILTRTNEELGQIQDMLDKKEIPNITFKKGDLDIEELANLLETNKVKVLTIHSAKGLENKNVIVVGARMYNYDERRIAYVAATRAENALYWCTFMRHKKKGARKDSTCAGDIFSKTEVETIKF
jgi:superfamily I DNA/RNA helicase